MLPADPLAASFDEGSSSGADEIGNLERRRGHWGTSSPTVTHTPQKLPSCLLGCRGNWGQLVSEAGGFGLEMLDLQLPVLKLMEGRSLVHVFHPVAQHAIEQTGQLGGHGLDGDGSP